ncbi:MAG: ACP S-malonyltransferase [Ignavibacteriae bacterium]|nr:ACP S-malonyltransferase [Ignavibacteriota bacterium]MCB9214972.1 ACP S-malonyltransferase [Ignavibacteria bacterium]
MRVFLFPGQGSQFVGMGIDAYRESGTIRDIFDRANDVLGYRLTEVMFDGPEENLRATQNAQPALFLHAYALYQTVENPGPAMMAGHSLGEYTALAVAGALRFDDALTLVRLRAEAMAEAGQMQVGTMGAVIGLNDDAIREVCERVSRGGDLVVPANFNSEGQVVISGTPEGVRKAMAEAKEAGARMVTELSVSGAFHSPLMKPAEEKLAEALSDAPIRDAEVPVYMNVSAQPVTDATTIRDGLLRQLTAPVLWTQTIKGMIADGGREFIEVGPGNVLQKLVGRISRDVAVSGLGKLEQINTFNHNSENNAESAGEENKA